MDREIKVACPGCQTILIVDRITGELIETRKPLVEKSSGDRFIDAFTKAKDDRDKRAGKLDDIAGQLEKKRKMAEELFKASLNEAKKEKDIKPNNIFDLD
ncbi:MAG: hypothetical protein HZB29_11455 [Nitrospinae bacterium]|nr:hypothetical protein [Nitrospinota bacterium]